MILKLQNTMQVQRKALNELEMQLERNKVQKKDRVAHMLAAGLSTNDIIRSSSYYTKPSSPFLNNTSAFGADTAAATNFMYTGQSSPSESRTSRQKSIFG